MPQPYSYDLQTKVIHEIEVNALSIIAQLLNYRETFNCPQAALASKPRE
jgi:hypothetical protein